MTISFRRSASVRSTLSGAVAALITVLLASGCGGGGDSVVTFADCGNGIIDPGEECDDGNSAEDNDACLSTCVLNTCGDGFVNRGAEDCDGVNLDSNHCGDLGLGQGTLRCDAACKFDTSGCGPVLTPTPTGTPRPSFPSPTPTPEPCGNGLIERGEACADCPEGTTCQGCLPNEPCQPCPEDCSVSPCTASASTVSWQVDVNLPPGQNVGTVSVLLAYRSDMLSLPSPPASRITNLQPGGFRTLTDFDYALQYIYTLPSENGLASGGLFTVRFDVCEGSAPSTTADFRCVVQACTGSAGQVEGCTCSVSAPPAP